MKKLITILLLSLATIFYAGCQTVITDKDAMKEESMFILVEETDKWCIVYHKESKVMYAVSRAPYNQGTFTLLVDEDGRPLLWQNN